MAEATIPSALIREHMRIDSATLFQARQVSNLGSAIVAEEWVHAHDLYGRNR